MVSELPFYIDRELHHTRGAGALLQFWTVEHSIERCLSSLSAYMMRIPLVLESLKYSYVLVNMVSP